MAEEKALGLSVLSTIRDWVKSLIPTKTSDLTNDSGYITGMTILSYGNSTWSDFLAAYNANKVVYARASSNANPASGTQTRLAFLAYVNNATNPSMAEFQYYRSVSSHSESQQGDQVYIYTLKSSGWTVAVREAYTKIAAGTNMSQSYASGTLTLNATQPSVPQATSTTPLMDGTAAVGTETKWAKGDHVHPTDTSRQELLVSGTNIKTINNTSLLGAGNITIESGGYDEALSSQEVEAAVDAAYPSAFAITKALSGATLDKTSAEEGETVTLTFTSTVNREPGTSGLFVVKTEDTSVIVTLLTSDTQIASGSIYTFIMPAFDVTIQFQWNGSGGDN